MARLIRRQRGIDPDLAFDLARFRLDHQLDFVDQIDNKLGLLFSIASALIGVLGAVVATQHTSITGPEIGALGASLGSYLYLAQNAVRQLWGATVAIGPELDRVAQAYAQESSENVKLRAAETLIEAYDDNYAAYVNHLRAMRRCLVALATETLSLLVALALAVWA